MSYTSDSKKKSEMTIRVRHAINIQKEIFDDIKMWAGGSFKVIEISALCKDDIVRKFEDFDELAEYKNDPEGELCSLKFTMKDSNENRISAKITNEPNILDRSETAYYSVEGADDICIQIQSNIRKDMKSYKPWYSLIALLTFNEIIFAFFGLSDFYFFLRIIGVIEFDSMTQPIISFNMLLYIIATIIPITWILIRLGNYFKKFVFPPVTFSIGHGKIRNENREWIRRSVVATAIFSILAGILNLVFSKI